jgi:hypothetical protein
VRLPRLEEIHLSAEAINNDGEPNDERLVETRRLIIEALPKVRVIFD